MRCAYDDYEDRGDEERGKGISVLIKPINIILIFNYRLLFKGTRRTCPQCAAAAIAIRTENRDFLLGFLGSGEMGKNKVAA